MKKIIAFLKKIPLYGYLAGIILFALQYGLYRLGDYLSRVIGTIDYAFCPKIPLIDNLFKVVPFFIVIYYFSYVFWIMGPIAVSLTKKEHFINYVIGLLGAYLIGFLIFIFFPSYMNRQEEGILQAVSNNSDVFSKLLEMCYLNDGEEMAFNLFPSYHCLISVYCYLGVARQKEISLGFRIYSLVMFILIVLSTLFTKQHYVLDCLGGISISLFCYFIVKLINPGKRIVERKLSKESK